MLGLVVLLVIGLYLLVSVLVVRLAVRWAWKRGRRGWIWGGATALVMYHLVFWDLIPTLVLHKYYCAAQAGVWIYKTPEQWVKENPGVLNTLSLSHLPEKYRVPNAVGARCGDRAIFGNDGYYLLPDGTCLLANYDVRGELTYVDFASPDGSHGYQLNERIRYLTNTNDSLPLSIRRHDMELIDIQEREVLERYVGFSWGQGNALELGIRGQIRALGTAYLAGGGSCSTEVKDFMDYVSFFRDKEKNDERQ